MSPVPSGVFMRGLYLLRRRSGTHEREDFSTIISCQLSGFA